MDKNIYNSFVSILRHELVPALGCTEPIAIAFASAKARDILGKMPEHVKIGLSGNMIKNVKSVIVPNSGGQRGIEAAVALGCIGGKAELKYEVLQMVTPEDMEKAKELAKSGFCVPEFVDGKDNLYIRVFASAGNDSSLVIVEREHTNITHIEKNGEVIFSLEENIGDVPDEKIDKTLLSVARILEFANAVDLSDIQDILKREVEMNTAISAEGLSGNYGANVGKILMSIDSDHVESRAAACAAAGSDARMNGCSMPVVINSGSGNQGMTITLPICEYAATWKKSTEILYRALVVGNLISVHIKRRIGNLSAFCGAVCAGTGAACGIAYMDNCSYDQICMVITNTLLNVGGMVCDGAKSSCASKIASAVTAGTLSYRMAKNNVVFQPGEGLAGNDIEETIENIGRMGRVGMRSTDAEILNIMVGT